MKTLSAPVRIVIATVSTLAVGWTSSLLMGDALVTWYPFLRKPAFDPPNAVFAPVWTVLYVLMGLAAGLVWARGLDVPGRRALRLYAVQLVLNVTWTGLFFGLRMPLPALAELAVLIVLIGACLRAFRRLRPVAGWLLLPYLAWSCFAFVLNAAIVVLNSR